MIKPKIHEIRYPGLDIVDVSAYRTPARRPIATPSEPTGLSRRQVVRANIVRLIPGRTRLPYATGTV
jgi:hypothetical protein